MSDFGVATDEQLSKINKLAKRTLGKDEVFVFGGKSAGDLMIPGRHTRLSQELLQVMVDDAKKGVSFMLNHNWSSGGIQGIPYGKVFDGRIIPSSAEGETVEMHLDKFIFRDDEVTDGVSANSLIKRIETGILSDTSIGFSTDRMTCSICNMNYWSRDCSHYRGGTYTMEDGSKKTCFVTAMSPSVIIPYNNNALFEESIVWDGAYPGAIVTQSKHGDIIEMPSGKFSIVDDKEELPNNVPIIGQYHNGNLVTMVKKSDHNKVFPTGGLDNVKLKGSDKDMYEENVLKSLEALGIEYIEGMTAMEALEKVAEKWDTALQTIRDSAAPLQTGEGITDTNEYLAIPVTEITEKFGIETSGDELMRLAKEGQDYHTQTIEDAIAMGVRAQGNDFTAETWKTTFATMSTKAIKDIMKTFELQARDDIPTGRLSTPDTKNKLGQSLPDEAYRV
ncbi:MAG TPA: hypothetical protein GX707_09885 [Epulopiscium sp.]|nr:hypothetical protein [Candidatus Epulonipiscium sp.]